MAEHQRRLRTGQSYRSVFQYSEFHPARKRLPCAAASALVTGPRNRPTVRFVCVNRCDRFVLEVMCFFGVSIPVRLFYVLYRFRRPRRSVTINTTRGRPKRTNRRRVSVMHSDFPDSYRI